MIHRRRREGPADNDLDTSPCAARKTPTLGTTAGQTDMGAVGIVEVLVTNNLPLLRGIKISRIFWTGLGFRLHEARPRGQRMPGRGNHAT